MKNTPVASIVVYENRFSGCGMPAIPLHAHWVLAAPPQYEESLYLNTNRLWSRLCGITKTEIYDPTRGGAHYIAKLAGGRQFEWDAQHLDRLDYFGPQDMFEHFQSDPYAPDHARPMTSGETLSIRYK